MDEAADAQDWRLTDKEDYYGVALYRRRYRRYSDQWDHDHCDFCWAKFMDEQDGIPGTLHEGYVTEKERTWICPRCFEDFRERFAWNVLEPEGYDGKAPRAGGSEPV